LPTPDEVADVAGVAAAVVGGPEVATSKVALTTLAGLGWASADTGGKGVSNEQGLNAYIASMFAMSLETAVKGANSSPTPKEGCVGDSCSGGGPRGKTGCFVAGTPVWTENGPIAIESIEDGMLVLSASDEGTGSLQWSRVGKRFERHVDSTFVLELRSADSTQLTIETTAEHPFWNEENGWVHAGELKVGTRLWTVGHGWAELTRSLIRDVQVPVYNLLVDGTHTYFVGEAGAWVHNQDCGDNAGNSGGKPAARAGHNGVHGPAQQIFRETRGTRDDGRGTAVKYPDGSSKDITSGRVKESVPNRDPRAPPGTSNNVKFTDAQPGSKGLKRDPTPEELEMLK
jgi:hypothetical protein